MKFTIIKYFLLSIICQGILFPSTYNLVGRVFDLEKQQPISNANIFIDNKNIGTTTNEDGYFILFLEGYSLNNKINLVIKFIGYEEKKIFLYVKDNENNLGTIYLKPKSIKLDTIRIDSQKDKSKQISDIFISGKELNENLKGNIATTLANQPNIGINSFGIITSKPSLRGFSGDRFLLTKDGNETGDLSQSAIDHAISLDMTEVNEIEIIRGPKALIYGQNAIGGVINTTLVGNPKIRFNKFTKQLLIGTDSSNDSEYGNFMLYIPFKSNQLNLFYSNRITQNQNSPEGELVNTQSGTDIYKLGITHYYKKNYVNLIIETFDMHYGIPPYPLAHEQGVDIVLLKNTYQLNFNNNISFGIFNQLDIQFNYIDYVHVEMINANDNSTNIDHILENRNFHVALAKKTENYKISISGKKIIYGLEYIIRKFVPDGFYLTPTTNENQLSLFGFQEYKIKNLNIDFLSSFRIGYLLVNPGNYNYNFGGSNLILKDEDGNPILDNNENRISLVDDRKFQSLSYSFGFRKKINEFEYNSWFMHTTRPPRVEELFSDGPHLASYAFEIGNPNLDAEKIYGIENSIRYNSNNLNASFVAFYNYSPYYFQMTKDGLCEIPNDWNPWETHPCYGADFIDWGSGEFGWLHKYSSKGNEVVIKGFEFSLGYQMNKFDINYNLSFVQGDDLTFNMPLSYINPMKEIITLGFMDQFLTYKIKLTNISPQERLGEFETETPGAYLVDCIIAFSFNPNNNLTLHISNITNRTYYNHLSRIKDLSPEPGNNLNLNYKLTF